MELIKPDFCLVPPGKVEHMDTSYEVYRFLERIGRVCYRSESRAEPGSAERFVRMLMERKHLSIIEHYTVSIEIRHNRAFTHELVRHRLAAYAQESQRFVNYRKADGIQFVYPAAWDRMDDATRELWTAARAADEWEYGKYIEAGLSPEEARDGLPNCTATTIIITTNLREWLHVFNMRRAAGVEMRRIIPGIETFFRRWLPVIFGEPQGE